MRLSNPRVPMAILLALVIGTVGIFGYAVGKGDTEVVTKTEVKTVEKRVEIKVPQKSDPKATCMYDAILAYPEYVAIGGDYESNGNKQLLDVLPNCMKISKKDKVKMRAALNSMINSPLP